MQAQPNVGFQVFAPVLDIDSTGGCGVPAGVAPLLAASFSPEEFFEKINVLSLGS